MSEIKKDTKYHYDKTFQLRILACMLTLPNFLYECRNYLNPTYFDYEDLKYLVRLTLDFFDKYRKIPEKVELMELINESIDKYFDDADERRDILETYGAIYHTNVETADFVVEKVIEFGEEQTTRKNLLKIGMMLDDYSGNRDKIRDLMLQTSDDRVIQVEDSLSLEEDWEDIPAKIASQNSVDDGNKIPTNIMSLNKALKGGMGKGQVGWVIALSGYGKSNVLVNFGGAARRNGFNVLHVTNELHPIDLGHRYGSHLTGLHLDHIHEAGNRDKYMNKMRAIMQLGGVLDMVYFTPYSLTIPMLRSFITRRQNARGIKYDLLIIDAFYRLGGIDPETGWVGEGQVSKALIALLHDFNLACWVADQPTKGTDRNELIHYQRMAGDGDKFQDADVVISLNQFDNMRDSNSAVLYQSKGRRGGEDTKHDVFYDRDRCTMIDWDMYTSTSLNAATVDAQANN